MYAQKAKKRKKNHPAGSSSTAAGSSSTAAAPSNYGNASLGTTKKHTVSVSNVKQSNKNSCWAAVALCIHGFKGTDYKDQATLVEAVGKKTAKTAFANNTVADIDCILGGGAKKKILKESDAAGSFPKTEITDELGKGKPIVANINSDHYVVICGTKEESGTTSLKVMDPYKGTQKWYVVEEDSTGSITGYGNQKLSVLYYM